MFDMTILQFSTKVRSGAAVDRRGRRDVRPAPHRPARAADAGRAMVACYIGAAYWFTASTSFANPRRVRAACSATASPASRRPASRVRRAELCGAAPRCVRMLVRAVRSAADGRVQARRSLAHPPCLTSPIYHNPACGTSRNTLALMRHAGIEPVVIEYLKTPPARNAARS
jgi:hypothetical protein